MKFGGEMNKFHALKKRFHNLLFLVGLLGLASCAQTAPLSNGVTVYKAPSNSRSPSWGPEYNELAKKGVLIADQRSEKEAVVLIWLSASLVGAGGGQSAVSDVINDNIILATFRLVKTDDGAFQYQHKAAPALRTLSDIAIPPLAGSQLSPLAAGVVAIFQQSLRQSLKIEKDIEFIHAFAGQSVDACQPGGFWVRFEGVDYTFNTPLGGCQNIIKPDVQARFSAHTFLFN